MTLAQLLSQLSEAVYNAASLADMVAADIEVTGVAQDSRQVQAGYVFVARRGEQLDGHRFIPAALQQGAIAIVGEGMAEGPAAEATLPVPYIRVSSDKIALAQLAAAFHQHPSEKLTTIGVTGTDGKTTTANLLHHLLHAHQPTGLLSTAGIRIGQETLPMLGHFTTPEASEVQGYLARFVQAGMTHAIVESSSHGFAMHRLDAIAYDLGIITNLSPEHLDYHGTLEHYRAAKAALLQRAAVSVINADDAHADYFRAQARGEVITYGMDKAAMWRAIPEKSQPSGLYFRLEVTLASSPQHYHVFLPMLGDYNIYNALAAMAAAHRLGVPIPSLISQLANFSGVAGRMQSVQTEPFAVIVDFAHTPDALQKAIQALRSQTTGAILVVLGAAGERDAGKRAPLGRIAVEQADKAIFTEEDSRSEDVQAILETMATGARAAGGQENEDFWRIVDRQAAIRFAISLAHAGDVVLLCGKGHEDTLERRHETIPWDEVAEARAALEIIRHDE